MSEITNNQASNSSKFSALFVILIIFANIITDQSINTVILEFIQPLDVHFRGGLTTGFMAISIPGSLLLAGWSDFHCRRRTIILTLFFASLSFILMVLFKFSNNSAFGIASLIIKGILGNVTPICLATLADIISKKRFRNALALAIVAYSIGIWIPIYFKSSLETESNFLVLLSVIVITSIICTVLFVKDDKFDHVNFYKNPANIKSFLSFFKKDTKLIILFLLSPILAPALLCFFFGEISYYQFLFRGALLTKADFYVSQALVLAIGYYIGTIILLILGFLNIKDITCIKIGLLISLISSGVIVFEHSSSMNTGIHLNVLVASFSIGFALVTPSLFASISKISREEEQGKIYGSLDSTETLATLSSTLIIKRTQSTPIYLIVFFTFVIFALSCIFFLRFLKRYRQAKIIP